MSIHQHALNKNLKYLNDIKTAWDNATDANGNVNTIATVSGVSTESKQDTMITNQGTHNTHLNNIHTDTTSLITYVDGLETNTSTANTHLSAIKTAVEGTLNISNSAGPTAVNQTSIKTAVELANTRQGELYASSHTALVSNGSQNSGVYSSSIDLQGSSSNWNYTTITIYGKTSSSTARLHYAVSGDDTTFYICPEYADTFNDGTDDHFRMSFVDCPFRYVRVYVSNANATGLYLNYVLSKH